MLLKCLLMWCTANEESEADEVDEADEARAAMADAKRVHGFTYSTLYPNLQR